MSTVTEWRPIYGQPGYEASSDGRVRSLKNGKCHELKQRVTSNGYLCVMLSQKGKYRPYGVHRLMLLAFEDSDGQGLHACHKDGNRTNNRLDNLYWGTPVQNAADMKRHGRHRNGRKTHCKNNHEFTPENTYVQTSNGARRCITCRDSYWAEWSSKKRLAPL
jgi:hypothetical protein